MTNAKQDSKICVWDFTVPRDKMTIQELQVLLIKECKKWAFQVEEGNTGYRHFQGRLSLKLKLRKSSIIKKLPSFFHVSITSSTNQDNNFYVLKEDTRIEGPFTSENYIYIPRQIREITTLYPWQKSIIDKCNLWDTRHIDLIVQPKGNVGKTILTGYMESYGYGEVVPYCNDYKDLMRMICCIGAKRCYLLDLPKALNKDRLHSLYAGIETIKDGRAYDDRYHYKKLRMDCPNIFVFTNTIPDLEYMSMDRWRFWKVENNHLVKNEECYITETES